MIMKSIVFIVFLAAVMAEDRIKKRNNMIKAEWESLRVHLDYTATTARVKNGEIRDEDFYSVKKDLKILKAYLEALVKVKPNTDNLKIEANQCGDINIPSDLASDGAGMPSTDLYLFVIFEDGSELTDNNVSVEGSVCSNDSVTNRPVSGVVKFSKNQQRLIKPILQELLSILGFNYYLLDLFVDPYTLKALKTDQILKKTELNGQESVVSVGTNSLKQAKKHFGCEKLQGVPFAKGDDYTESRWDRRYMNTDVMTESDDIHFELSPITLGFLEDTGWYKPNYSLATSFQWGSNTGCSFFTDPCLKKGSYAKKPFCSKQNKQMCSFDFKFKGSCTVKAYNSTLPAVFQYFDDAKTGGTDKDLNYCPVVQEENYCFTVNEDSYGKERNCKNCACFTEIEGKKETPKCYRFKCLNGNLSVLVGSLEVKCDKGEAKYESKRVVCPPPEVVCGWKHEWI